MPLDRRSCDCQPGGVETLEGLPRGHRIEPRGPGRRALAAVIGALAAVTTTAQTPPKGSPISTLGTVEEFPPVAAQYVRMTILKTTADIFPILNEVVIYTAQPQPRNVALAANGAKASAQVTRDAAWSVEYLNDGLSTGWWAGQAAPLGGRVPHGTFRSPREPLDLLPQGRPVQVVGRRGALRALHRGRGPDPSGSPDNL